MKTLKESTYISEYKKEYRWERCEACCEEYYKLYVQKQLLWFKWWSRINDVELTTIDEIIGFINKFEKNSKKGWL
jgi:hypothetical protein